eukprot:CAMPEP_0194079314 /NCGR_PEP_ID=MMETSP0149-20130528/5541_1 /TAXON_ID=122233 /ORGANISM="Chaetoceros debilis, Strain MM31A-1" /LENGTH=623 /DNA_ID=CAMNT_0038760773 /DNA_START=171 /DNA_END=2039 /DNA_ORIENTATION=+
MVSDEELKQKKKSKKKEKKMKKKRKHEEITKIEKEKKNISTSTDKDDVSQVTPKSEKKRSKKDKKQKKDKSKKKDKKSKTSKQEKSPKKIEEENDANTTEELNEAKNVKAAPNDDDLKIVGGRIVSFSADVMEPEPASQEHSTTLLLFYQYIEPVLDEDGFQAILEHVQVAGEKHQVTGRMRTSYEGLNCTLTGSYDGVRGWCKDLRDYNNGAYFADTEFKLTDNLPSGQAFPTLHAFKVDELVNYGLSGIKAPSIHMSGEHLEPKDYDKKMKEKDTVIIDVRNHYEASIGRFQPPVNGAQYIDPMMRKSTEFPVWLDKPETKDMLRGKQVLMYCTGGVRCERASALLRTKMENEDDTKALGIKGVFQLQGGIDKYFRDFPEGGSWRGKNYTFDKRFSHAPPALEGMERVVKKKEKEGKEAPEKAGIEVMGKCEACHKPWDMFRGKRRCPTCGVPSLICKECYQLDKDKIKKLDRSVRCDLCVKEGIRSKHQVREKVGREMEAYETKLREIYGFQPTSKKSKPAQRMDAPRKKKSAPNPKKITKLFVKNLCAKEVDQLQLCELIPGITHIEWIMDRKTGNWYGSVFVEVATPEDASIAVGSLHKQKCHGRVLNVSYLEPDPKS